MLVLRSNLVLVPVLMSNLVLVLMSMSNQVLVLMSNLVLATTREAQVMRSVVAIVEAQIF